MIKKGGSMKQRDWTGNGNSIYKTLGATNHTDKEREKNDYYATDPIAIDKLLSKQIPNKKIWECACGEGHLSKRLYELGFEVYSSDIVNRGFGAVEDFLKTKQKFDGDILTNPPYKYAKEFVLKALEIINIGSKVYMFLKIQFAEGKARYKNIFCKCPPKFVYVFSERVMCAKNGNFEQMRATGGSAVCYSWYIWEKGYHGPTIFDWI